MTTVKKKSKKTKNKELEEMSVPSLIKIIKGNKTKFAKELAACQAEVNRLSNKLDEASADNAFISQQLGAEKEFKDNCIGALREIKHIIKGIMYTKYPGELQVGRHNTNVVTATYDSIDGEQVLRYNEQQQEEINLLNLIYEVAVKTV